MKKFISLTSLLLAFFFIVGDVYAKPFIEAYIEGATFRNTDGTVTPYRLQAGSHNLGDSGVIPANNSFVDLGDGAVNREIPFDNQFYDGSRFRDEFWQYFYSLSPTDYNGNIITFTHGTDVVTAAVVDCRDLIPSICHVILPLLYTGRV